MRICNSIVIDLFAGSGSLGIEALSRDASKVYFIDNNRNSIQSIKENLKKTGLIKYSKVIHTCASSGIIELNKNKVRADIIFLDPPYSRGFIEPVLKSIFHYNILQPDGIIILEHNIKDEPPNNAHKLKKYRTNKYGNVAVSFYRIEEGN